MPLFLEIFSIISLTDTFMLQFNYDSPLSRFSLIEFLRYVFKCLKIENDLFLVLVITGKGAKIIKSLYIIRYICSLNSVKMITTFL